MYPALDFGRVGISYSEHWTISFVFDILMQMLKFYVHIYAYICYFWLMILVIMRSFHGSFAFGAKGLLSFGLFRYNADKMLVKGMWSRCISLSVSEACQHNSLPTFLTHWGRATHLCVGELTIIGSNNGLSPGRRQAIIWTNAGILLIRPWGTNFSENFIGNQVLLFKKMHLKM